MKKRRWYMALLAMGLTLMTVPILGAPEQNSTPSASEQRAMTILGLLSQHQYEVPTRFEEGVDECR
jgi:hypothetical protein